VPPVDSEAHPPGGTLRQRIEQALLTGASVAVFADVPIGTPAARSRFRLEAIQAARDAGAPVYPVLLNTSAVQAGDGPAHAAVTVAVGTPLHPAGDDPRQLVEWRDQIRRAIVQLHDAGPQ
jgi:1-acyl-sn-glycerol-3-phosphate acyltransferase